VKGANRFAVTCRPSHRIFAVHRRHLGEIRAASKVHFEKYPSSKLLSNLAEMLRRAELLAPKQFLRVSGDDFALDFDTHYDNAVPSARLANSNVAALPATAHILTSPTSRARRGVRNINFLYSALTVQFGAKAYSTPPVSVQPVLVLELRRVLKLSTHANPRSST
jgi:hypothetical protein